MAIKIVNKDQIKPIMKECLTADDAHTTIISIKAILETFEKVKYVSINQTQFPLTTTSNYTSLGLIRSSKFAISEQILTALTDWAKNYHRMKLESGNLLDVFKLPGVGAENGLKLYVLFSGFNKISYDFASVVQALYELDKSGNSLHTLAQYRYDLGQLPTVTHSALSVDDIVRHVVKIRDIQNIKLGMTEYIATKDDIRTEQHFCELEGCQIITGGGGTGKTTTIVNAANHFISEGWSVIILTPTNKAKAVLLSRLPEELEHTVMTVDSYNLAESYKSDVIIVDEASMLTNYHFKVIMDRPARNWTYLVGDPQQLPPVGTGALFSGLISKNKQPITKLEKNYRTEATDILDLANSIVKSRSISLTPSACVEIIEEPNYDEMVKEPNSHVITHTRAVTNHVNKLMNDLARQYNIRPKFKYMANDSTTWYRNRMVVRGGKDYYDADTGEYLERDDNWNEHHLEPGFCTTIHTAQGGGWDTVYLILNLEGFRAWDSIEKELLYTAVTRAKKRLVIVTTWDKVKLKRYPRRTLINEGLL